MIFYLGLKTMTNTPPHHQPNTGNVLKWFGLDIFSITFFNQKS